MSSTVNLTKSTDAPAVRRGRPPLELPSKTQVRKVIGRGKFTIGKYAAAQGLSYHAARRAVQRMAAEGTLDNVGTADPEGQGRPATLYRVAANSK